MKSPMELRHSADYSLQVLFRVEIQGDDPSPVKDVTEASGLSRNHLQSRYIRERIGGQAAINSGHLPAKLKVDPQLIKEAIAIVATTKDAVLNRPKK